MIKIITKNIDGETVDSDIAITGSGKELIQDFFELHDALQKNYEVQLLYGIAIKKWESQHEDN